MPPVTALAPSALRRFAERTDHLAAGVAGCSPGDALAAASEQLPVTVLADQCAALAEVVRRTQAEIDRRLRHQATNARHTADRAEATDSAVASAMARAGGPR